MQETDLKQVVGRRIREEREARKLTQTELADQLGIDAPRLSRIERGERGVDTLVLRRAARFFDMPMDAFFESGQPELTLARRGDADDEAMQAMLEWGRSLHRNGSFVRSELAARG